MNKLISEGNLVPLSGQIILKVTEKEETTSGSIIIPETVKTSEKFGEVVAVSDVGRILDNGTVLPMQVQIGDIVVIKEFTGTDITLEGEQYKFVRESDLVGVIRGE